MSRPARLDARYTYFDRFLVLWDRMADLFRGRTQPKQTARLAVEMMEDRVVPTAAAVWLGPDTQLLPEGASGGIWAYRSGGDTTQPLTVQLSFGSNGATDPLATWNVDYALTGPGGGSGGSSASLGASIGTVTFDANETAALLNLAALTDSLIEGTEGFRVTMLDGGTNYYAGMGSGGGSGGSSGTTADIQITDVTGSGGSGGSGSAVVWVGPESQIVPEGISGGVWVYRSGGNTAQSLALRLKFGLDGQSDPLACWGDDFELFGPSGGALVPDGNNEMTVSFAPGQTELFLPLEAKTDGLVEGMEGVRLSVVPDPNYVVGLGSGSGGSGGWAGATTDAYIIDTTNQAPVVGNLGSQTDVGGGTVGLQISATDPNNDPLIYSATGLPPGLSVNPATGFISGTIGAGATANSPYTVAMSVSDGVVSTSQTFSWAIAALDITNPGSQHNLVGDSVPLASQVRGVPGTLTFSASGLPMGLSIDAQTGLISGTIASTAHTNSPYPVTISATDGTLQASQSFSWSVSRPAAPSLENPGHQFGAAGDEVLLQLSATSASATPLAYSATGLPAGLSINQNTGLISGTISNSAASATPHEVTVTTTDGVNTVSQSFSWVANFVSLESPGTQYNDDEDTVSLTLQAHSASGTLTFGATGLPTGLTINQNTGVISGTLAITASQGSPYAVSVTASDGTHTVSRSFTWYVGELPVLSLDQPDDQVNATGDTVSLQLVAIDWDTPLLTYSASGLPAGLSIDASTGLISGVISDTAASATPYQVTATVADGTNSVSQTFTWAVNYVGLESPGPQFNNVAEEVSLALHGHGAVGPLTFSATGLPSGLSVSTSTGVITGTIASGADAASPYDVTVTATDGTHSTSQSFEWYVSSQPTLALDSPGDQVSSAGDDIALGLSAIGASTATLVYSATGLPTGLVVDPSDGAIAGTIADGAASSTPYQVTVSVSDGTNTVSQTFWWTVNFTSLTNPGDQFDEDGDVVSLQLGAHNALGRSVTYSAVGLPTGLSINPSTGLISGTLATNASTESPYVVTVTASDGMRSDRESFRWNVSPRAAIALDSLADQANAVGDVISLQLVATSATSCSISYSASGLPTGLNINSSTGLISGTTAANAASDTPYQVTVAASDGTNTASQTFMWRVTQYAAQADVPGETLATAQPISFDESGMSLVPAMIGDNSFGSLDVDLYRVQLGAGDSVTVRFQALAAGLSNDPNFKLALRVFDASGTELLHAGVGTGLQVSDRVTFTAPAGGAYYVGITHHGNTTYNPLLAGSGVGGLTGAYAMTLFRVAAQEKVAAQWNVTRNPDSAWAVAKTTDPAKTTIAGLAKTVGLEPQEAAKWLSWEDPTKPGKLTAQQNQQIIDDLKDPTKTVAEIFGPKTEFWVPNRVIAYWGGEGKGAGRYWVRWDADIAALTEKGYKVEYAGYVKVTGVEITLPRPGATPAEDLKLKKEYQQKLAAAQWAAAKDGGWQESPWTAETFLKKIQTGTKDKSLVGVVLWGHGNEDGILLNASANGEADAQKYAVKYDAWRDAEEYKLGLGVLYVCKGGSAQSAERIKDGTTVFATNGIFWGVNNTLIPPLAPPAVQKVLRKLKQVALAPENTQWPASGNPPDVANILKKFKDIQ